MQTWMTARISGEMENAMVARVWLHRGSYFHQGLGRRWQNWDYLLRIWPFSTNIDRRQKHVAVVGYSGWIVCYLCRLD